MMIYKPKNIDRFKYLQLEPLLNTGHPMQRFIAAIFLCILALFTASACMGQSKSEPADPPKLNTQGEYRLTVQLGEPVQQTYQRNPGFFEVGESGFGPGFMYPLLPTDEIPKARVDILDEDYKTAFNMSTLTDIRFVHDSNYPELGTGHFFTHLPNVAQCQYENDAETNPECSEEVISKKLFEQYMEIVKLLKQYNWQPYIDLEYPRLSGEESWQGDFYEDGYYIDTYEKWQQYAGDEIFVMFYHKNLILQVSVDTTAPVLEMYTNHFEYLFRYDEETRGERWKEYLARDIPKWSAQRQQRETELKAKGYSIAENYQDAPLPDYK